MVAPWLLLVPSPGKLPCVPPQHASWHPGTIACRQHVCCVEEAKERLDKELQQAREVLACQAAQHMVALAAAAEAEGQCLKAQLGTAAAAQQEENVRLQVGTNATDHTL